MDKKQMYVQVVNLTKGKVFSLPTLYTDRTKACVRGQNYVRDRHQENHDDVFYRVLIAKDGKVAEPSYFTIVEDEDDEACPHPEQECCEGCPFFSECWEDEDENEDFDWENPACQSSHKEDSEKSDYRKLMESILEVCEEYGVDLVIPRT